MRASCCKTPSAGYTTTLMSHKAWIVVSILVFVGVLMLALLFSSHPVIREAPYPEPVAQVDLSGKALYANGEYGFVLVYPEAAQRKEAFSPWHSTDTTEGVGILSLTLPQGVFSVGVSENEDARARCIEVQEEETVGEKETLSGVTWSVAKKEGYLRYAVLHKDRCYIMELSGSDLPVLQDIARSFSFAATQ